MGRVDTVQLAAGAVAGVQQTLVHEFFKIAVVNFRSPALGGSFLVPAEAQPLQIIAQNFRKIAAGALGVQIFHPQYHAAALTANRHPGDQRGEYVTQVHPSRGRRRKAPYHAAAHRSHPIHQEIRAAAATSSRKSRNKSPLMPFFLGAGT